MNRKCAAWNSPHDVTIAFHFLFENYRGASEAQYAVAYVAGRLSPPTTFQHAFSCTLEWSFAFPRYLASVIRRTRRRTIDHPSAFERSIRQTSLPQRGHSLKQNINYQLNLQQFNFITHANARQLLNRPICSLFVSKFTIRLHFQFSASPCATRGRTCRSPGA